MSQQNPNFDKIVSDFFHQLKDKDEKIRVILKLAPIELKEIGILLEKLRK